MRNLTIEITGNKKEEFFQIVNQIRSFLKDNRVFFSGPIFFPIKKLKINTRSSPDGEGSEKWDKWIMKIYKVIFQVKTIGVSLGKILKKIHFYETVKIKVKIK